MGQMRRAAWQFGLARGLVVLCALLACARQGLAWSYHSVTYGYSVSVPDDWQQVSDDETRFRIPDLPVLLSQNASVDVIFQPKRNTRGIDYPYIVVEVIPYSSLGYPQQVTDEEIRTVVRASTGLDPANPYNPDPQMMEGGAENESLEGSLDMEFKDRRYTYSWTSNIRQVGLVRQRQWGFFGRDAMVKLTLYERGRGSDRLRDMATAVAGSFKFGIGREYQPAFTLSDAVQMLKDLFAAPTLGMAVTLLCVGVSVVFALIAIFTSRTRVPGYGELRADGDLASFTPPDRYEL